MPGTNTWTINSETGGAKGTDLNDCLISQTATQTELNAPDGTVLGTVDSVTAPIDFDSFEVPGTGTKFTLSIKTFTYGGSENEAQGSWQTVDSIQADPESGEWTAMAGTGIPETKGKAAADA